MGGTGFLHFLLLPPDPIKKINFQKIRIYLNISFMKDVKEPIQIKCSFSNIKHRLAICPCLLMEGSSLIGLYNNKYCNITIEECYNRKIQNTN